MGFISFTRAIYLSKKPPMMVLGVRPVEDRVLSATQALSLVSSVRVGA